MEKLATFVVTLVAATLLATCVIVGGMRTGVITPEGMLTKQEVLDAVDSAATPVFNTVPEIVKYKLHAMDKANYEYTLMELNENVVRTIAKTVIDRDGYCTLETFTREYFTHPEIYDNIPDVAHRAEDSMGNKIEEYLPLSARCDSAIVHDTILYPKKTK